MMKKLFTLVALLACFMGVKAETIVDKELIFANETELQAEIWGIVEGATLDLQDGCLHDHSDAAGEIPWDTQFKLSGLNGITIEVGETYTLELKIKGSVEGAWQNIGFAGSDKYGNPQVTTDWNVVTLVYENASSSNASPLLQCGNWIGDWWIEYIKITHEGQKEQRPVTWQQWLTDDGNPIIPNVATESKYMGDAEFGQWPAWALEKEGNINANWRGNRTGEICAWALTMGRNFDDECPADINSDSYRARPFPADIEEDPDEPGNHVFVVRAEQVADIEGGGEGSIAWSNQFWIQSPKSWKEGSQIRIKFRYKADKACTAGTQIHKQYPSNYLHYVGAGDVNFTDEWQDFEQIVTFDGSQATGWSLAFNLNSGLQEPNTFYFDDLSWETMVLDEGYFVASANTTTAAVEYDYDNATEFVYDADEEAYVATVGTKGKQDSWVNELMISTIRGNKGAFMSNTIKPVGTITGNDPDNWQEYTPGSQYKIKLPAAGVWQIFIAPDEEKESAGQILFMQLEGDAPAEPVDIVENKTEIIIEGLERDDLKDTQGNDGITVREDPDDPNGETIGGEGHEGQTWDNQFFLVANRVLEPNEETVIEFDYVATAEFNCPTGTHAKPGDYRKNAIPDVAFTTEEQHLKVDYTVPASDWGGTAITDAQSIAFDLAVLKAANTYTIKNVKWYKKGDVNEEGKTLENLIDAEGTANFWVGRKGYNDGKVYQYGTDPTGIKSVVNKNNKINSDAIYNLSGQRVSKDYKGIVIKNGNKYIAK